MVNFLYPLLLMFVLLFAILEKTKILGDDKTQVNAIISLVISLIFVGAVFPTIIVNNLVQFMTVGLFVVFVVLMLWGFISGNKDLSVGDGEGRKIHKAFAILIFGGVVFAVLWATGFGSGIVDGLQKVLTALFTSDWSSSFWTNALVVILVLAVAFILTGFNPFARKTNWWIKLK